MRGIRLNTEEVVLVEGNSKKSDEFLAGRTDSNKVVIFPKNEKVKVGDYVKVRINKATSATLFADFLSIEIPYEKDIAKTA